MRCGRRLSAGDRAPQDDQRLVIDGQLADLLGAPGALCEDGDVARIELGAQGRPSGGRGLGVGGAPFAPRPSGRSGPCESTEPSVHLVIGGRCPCYAARTTGRAGRGVESWPCSPAWRPPPERSPRSAVRLVIEPVRARLRRPMTAAHGEVSERELLLVGLQAADGLAGWGEAAPLTSYDGVSMADVRAALEACRPLLADADLDPPPQVIARCAEVVLLAPALAALDLALWDLAGRRVQMPAWQLLGASSAPEPVRVNWTLTAADRSGAAAEAAQARAAGFDTLKAKVAIGDDHGRLAAVRAFGGPQMNIRIDANGAWTPAEAEVGAAHARAGRDRAVRGAGLRRRRDPIAERHDPGAARPGRVRG